jgi:Domain of unknown function (DUF4267)
MSIANQIAIGRIAVGVASCLAPRTAAKMFGFPTDHDNGTARALGRMFGAREIVLGAMVLKLQDDPRVAPDLYRLNAAVDAGDAAAMLTGLVKRDGIDRAAAMTLVVALGAVAGWVRMAQEASKAPAAYPPA